MNSGGKSKYLSNRRQKKPIIVPFIEAITSVPQPMPSKRLKNATAVIDMGERSVDANRWVFDLLAPGYGILCFLLGSRA